MLSNDNDSLAQCRICDGVDIIPDRTLPNRFDKTAPSVLFMLCRNCGTILGDDSCLLNYTDIDVPNYSDDHHLKTAISGTGYLSHTSLLSLCSQFAPQKCRFLDLGGGFGSLGHMAKLLYGWDITLAEPNPFAEKGAHALGINVFHGIVERETFKDEPFDIIFASEVMEHISTPDAFCQIIRANLKPHGFFVLTTPNAEVLADRSEMEFEELYGVGQHYNIFSPQSLKLVLARNHFFNIRTFLCHGTSGAKRIVCVACASPESTTTTLNFNQKTEVQQFIRYVEVALEEPTRDEWHTFYKSTLQILLFEQLVNQGKYRESIPFSFDFENDIIKKGINAENVKEWPVPVNLRDFSEHYPFLLGRYFYCKGMYFLNAANDDKAAHIHFAAAIYVLKLMHSFGLPSTEEMFGLAALHAGIALARLGRRPEAAAIFEETLALEWVPQSVKTRHYEELANCNTAQNGHEHAQVSGLERDVLKVLRVLATNTHLASPEQIAKGAPLVRQALADYSRLRDLGAGLENALRELRTDYPSVKRLGGKMEQCLERFAQALDGFDVAREKMEMAASSARQRILRLEYLYAEHGKNIHKGLRGLTCLYHQVQTFLLAIAAPFRVLGAACRAAKRVATRGYGALFYPGLTGFGTCMAFPPQGGRTQGQEDILSFTPSCDDVRVEQEFEAQHDVLEGLSLFLGHERYVNSCTLFCRLFCGEKELANRRLPSRLFLSNAFTRIPLPTSSGLKGKKLRLEVVVQGVSDEGSVSFWCRSRFGYGGMKLNGRPVFGMSLIVGQLEPVPLIEAERVTESEERDIFIITPGELGDIRVGVAMRHWEIAAALAAAGKRVTLASLQKLRNAPKGEGFVLLADDWRVHLPYLLPAHRAVFTQGAAFDNVSELSDYPGLLLVDLITPYHIENIHRGEVEFRRGCEELERMLKHGDAFVCGNEAQRVYWLGMLTVLRRLDIDENGKNVPHLFDRASFEKDQDWRNIVDIVGFGVRDEPPIKKKSVIKGVESGIDEDDFVVLWFGGIWDWLDPIPLLQATLEAHAINPHIKLYFSMYREKDKKPTIRAVEARKFADHHGMIGDSVFFREFPVCFAERDDYLLESDLGIFVQTPNVETTLSARTRVYDYIWAGLVPLMNEGDCLSADLKNAGAGIIIPEYSMDALRDTLLRASSDTAFLDAVRKNLRSFRQALLWNRQITPLLRHLDRISEPSLAQGDFHESE